jgi:hypothetical protein
VAIARQARRRWDWRRPGVPGDGIVPETGGEALEERLGERDLRKQDKCLAAFAQRFGNRLEIDFGLARSGHSVEQERGELRRPNRLDENRRRFPLRGLERRRGEIRVGNGIGIVDRDFDGLDRSGLDEAADDAVRHVGGERQLAHQPLPLADPLQRLAALRSEAFGNQPGGAVFGDGAMAVERRRRGERHAQHRRDRRQIIIRGPLDQPPKRRRDGRQIVGGDERAQAVVADALRLQPVLLPHHAGELPRPQRREHDRARPDAHAVRHAVVERPQSGVQRSRRARVIPAKIESREGKRQWRRIEPAR